MEDKSQQGIMAQWRPRQYVLTGAVVILAISTVTIVISILLRPAHIYFSVADLSYNKDLSDQLRKEGRTMAIGYAFNLTAHNPSRRAGVVYRYVLVSMRMGSHGSLVVRPAWVPARVTDDESSLHQGRNSNRTMAVQAVLDNDFLGFYSTKPYAMISVFAQAQFKVGLARSRVYNLRLKCAPIDFASVSTKSGTAGCHYLD